MSTARRPTYVLGVNSGIHKHDGAAALLRDGRLVAVVEQERISRTKHAWGEPASAAIRCCLDIEGITLADVAVIGFGWNEIRYAEERDSSFDENYFLAVLFPRAIFGPVVPPRRYFDHHLAHAASAFYTSGFNRSAIMVLDARGEFNATTLATAENNRIDVVAQFGLEESLGNFYALAAEWAGLSYDGAGKLMGLAPYGTPCERFPLRLTPAGYSFFDKRSSQRSYYHAQRSVLFASFGQAHPHCPGNGTETMSYANFAASAQWTLEAAVLHLASLLKEKTTSRNLSLAGGVALNCPLNARLQREGSWENLYVPPFANDAGVSVGAALLAWYDTADEPDTAPALTHAFWGPSFTNHEIEETLRESTLEFRRVAEDQLLDEVATRLHAGQLVGWFQGRAEVGPRSLGARSLLADPCRRSSLVRVNKAKRREMWRPLALSIVESAREEYFEFEHASDFMLFTAAVRPEMRARIPAVVHIDGTTRPHIVRPASNPLFYALLLKFGQSSGVPGVLNTSLNGPGQPIVHEPRQAIELVENGMIDCLAIGSYLARKRH